tara:strand:- start:2775 stop:3866 length:1092 start_codon:yes stop_codon:yes gene_type:complete
LISSYQQISVARAVYGLPFLCLIFIFIGCENDEHNSTAEPQPGTSENIFRPSFTFPTKNRALLDDNGSENFFTPTTKAKTWTSGTFGCVRNSGSRLHEGIDIASIERDQNNEPTDPVCAVFNGVVVHVNRNTATSNFGKYIVLYHNLDGFSFYSLYAHLSKIDQNIQIGAQLHGGKKLGVLGTTANTREKIENWRAHLHFEIGVQINSKFEDWFPTWYKDGKNHHGNWSGLNLLGLDPADILIEDQSKKIDFVERFASEPLLCRVRVYRKKIDYFERYKQLCVNVRTEKEPLAWDISFNFSGVPLRAEAFYGAKNKPRTNYTVLEVDENVYNQHRCSGLLFKRGQKWEFTSKGQRLMNLLIYN